MKGSEKKTRIRNTASNYSTYHPLPLNIKAVGYLLHIFFLVQVSNRYLSQLKDMDANHPFVLSLSQKEADFERMCKQYAITA